MRSKLVFIGVIFLVLLGFSSRGAAGVSINIGVSPPPLVIYGPPEVVVIPGTYVYFCPGVEADIFFYGGYWYRPYEGRWYKATVYDGPWAYIVTADVPYVLFHLPPDFRVISGYRRIPYAELHRNWRAWEREKYWDRVGWGRHGLEREREHGLAPPFRGEGERGRERHNFDTGRARERH